MISENNFRLKKDGTLYKQSFCRNPELIENYEAAIADTTHIWECHHRLETHNSDGERRLVDLSKKELIALDMYYGRPPEELIFLTKSEHSTLHNEERIFTEETKAKISASNKGTPPWNKGKTTPEETKAKQSAKKKGKHWRTENGRRVWY